MSKAKRIYIAGPMTGMPDLNFPAFHAAARRLRRAGWEVVNPAENFGGRTDMAREVYLRADVALLVQCDAIAMLPGWQDSLGAALEYLIADDSRHPIAVEGATVFPMPFDSGLSAGRNELVRRTTEKYLLFLDDDFVFTPETRIEHLHRLIEMDDRVGIAAGAVADHRSVMTGHRFRLESGTLYQDAVRDACQTHNGIAYWRVDFVPNFFLARRNVFDLVRWDDRKKLAEHTDFFLRCWKANAFDVLCTPDVRIAHRRGGDAAYGRYRRRAFGLVPITMRDHGLKHWFRDGKRIA